MPKYKIVKKFPTQRSCISYMEKLRWNGVPICPYCGSQKSSQRGDLRHQCNSCNRSYSVLVGSIFENTHLELPKFFALIKLMLNARNGISTMELSRNLSISYKSGWLGAMRVRCGMVEQIDDLQGIVEADESYIGGKPRKRNPPANLAYLSQVETDKKKLNKRGRGTMKVPVAGMVERDGRVVTKMMNRLTSKDLLALLHQNVKEDDAVLMTDDFKSYKAFDEFVQREVINHSKKEYVRGDVHTNTIEGFWSLVKSGITGRFKKLSKKYLPFYLAEFSYKYNRRSSPNIAFEAFMKDALSEEKCLTYYKPKGDVKKIVYSKKPKPEKAFAKVFIRDIKKARARKTVRELIRDLESEGYSSPVKKKIIIKPKFQKKKIIIKKRG